MTHKSTCSSTSQSLTIPCYQELKKSLFFAKGLCKNTDMKIGYAQVSTEEQNLELQRQALKTAGCEIIYEDKGISGTSTERHGLSKALKRMEKDDILVVWKLDRLGRSLAHLITFLDQWIIIFFYLFIFHFSSSIAVAEIDLNAAESYVIQQVRQGKRADFLKPESRTYKPIPDSEDFEDRFINKTSRVLRASFLEKLLTKTLENDFKVPPDGIVDIRNAVVEEPLNCSDLK